MEVCVIQSPLGSLRLSLSAKGLQRLEYLAPGSGLLPAASALSKKISQQLIAYFAGDAQTFDIPLDLIGTCYQKKVWTELLQLGFGETLSYGTLAQKIDSGARAVGNACRNNPILIIVPCHRVLRKDASGGYAGQNEGIMMQRKLWLLRHEAKFSQQSG